MTKFKSITLNHETQQLTVGAGVTFDQVYRFLSKTKFTLQSSVAAEAVTVVGAFCTGARTTGLNSSPLSEYVAEIKFIDGNGQDLTAIRSEGDDTWRVLKLSMGLCGIIYELTLDLVLAYNVYEIDTVVPKSVVLDKKYFNKIITGNDVVEILFFPYNSYTVQRTLNKVDLPITYTKIRRQIKNLTDRIKVLMAYVLNIFVAKLPILALYAQRYGSMLKLFENYNDVISSTDSFTWQNFNYSFAQLKTLNYEHALLFDDTDQVVDCLETLFDFFKSAPLPSAVPIVHIRFNRGSDAILSPTCNRNYVCNIDILNWRDAPKGQEFLHEIAKLLDKYPGAPLWSKDFPLDTDFKKIYGTGSNLKTFQTIRKEFDPNNIFVNDFFEKIALV
jgi:hypothetical protein